MILPAIPLGSKRASQRNRHVVLFALVAIFAIAGAVKIAEILQQVYFVAAHHCDFPASLRRPHPDRPPIS
jgi:uncharacterized protein involved in cysteine biosynthesis